MRWAHPAPCVETRLAGTGTAHKVGKGGGRGHHCHSATNAATLQFSDVAQHSIGVHNQMQVSICQPCAESDKVVFNLEEVRRHLLAADMPVPIEFYSSDDEEESEGDTEGEEGEEEEEEQEEAEEEEKEGEEDDE